MVSVVLTGAGDPLTYGGGGTEAVLHHGGSLRSTVCTGAGMETWIV